MKLTKVPAILALVTAVAGIGGWIHSHAADAVEEKDLAQKLMINMNTAEFQKFKTQLEFERLVLKPIAERTEYDTYNIEQLKDELAHWSGRIREIESR